MASVDRIRRLLLLVEVLQSGRSFNTVQLSDQCGVSRRTIFRDLRTLQDSGIPVEFSKSSGGYSLRSRIFVPPTDFTLNEALSVVILCNELGDRAGGIPFQQAAWSAGMKLLSSLPGQLREFVTEAAQAIDVRLAPFNRLDEAEPFYQLLTRAIARRRQVRIQYRSFMPDEPDEFSTLLSPYRLLFGRRSWYVIGRSSLHRMIRTFHLGRILKAETLESRFRIPANFSLNRYLGNAWFLIRERAARQNVVVRFQKMVAGNVAEVQWHKTQNIVWNDDGTLDFHVTVDGLGEIIWWILGYGDQAEALKPAALRKKISQKIAAMHNTYTRKPPRRRPAKRRKASGRK